MSNAGKKMINWRRDYPVLRVALGLLGKEGYVNTPVAKFLLTHECCASLREFCKKSLGRELNVETIQSRLKRTAELEWFVKNDPMSMRKGRKLKDELMPLLRKAGVDRLGALG